MSVERLKEDINSSTTALKKTEGVFLKFLGPRRKEIILKPGCKSKDQSLSKATKFSQVSNKSLF